MGATNFLRGVRDGVREFRNVLREDYGEFIENLTEQRKALEALAAEKSARVATGEEGCENTKVCGDSAVIQYCRDGSPGRMDVFCWSGLSVGIVGYDPFLSDLELVFSYGHAVIRHGKIVEWWLVDKEGRIRLSPLDEVNKWQTAKSLTGVAWRHKPFAKARKRTADLPGVSALVAVASPQRASLRLMLQGAVMAHEAARGSAHQDREGASAAAARQVAVLDAVVAEHDRFSQAVVDAAASGKETTDDLLITSRHEVLPGYFVLMEFRLHEPNGFTVFYSGDGGRPFGIHQGLITFGNNRVTDWLLLGDGSAHTRIV